MKNTLTSSTSCTKTRDDAQTRLTRAISDHGPWVLATCRRITRQQPLAEEAAQDVFILLARKLKQIPHERLPGWLYRCSTNIARRKLREEKRRRHRENEAGERQEIERRHDPEYADLAEILDDALQSLSTKQRNVILACFFEGLTQAELAERLDCSEAAVSKMKSRALGKLRERLERGGLALTVAALTALLQPSNLRAEASAAADTIERGVFAAGVAGLSTASTTGLAFSWAWASPVLGVLIAGLIFLLLWNFIGSPTSSHHSAADVSADGSNSATVSAQQPHDSRQNPGMIDPAQQAQVEAGPVYPRPQVSSYDELMAKLQAAYAEALEQDTLAPLLAFELPISETALAELLAEAESAEDFVNSLLQRLSARVPDEFLTWFNDLPEIKQEDLYMACRQISMNFYRQRMTSYIPPLPLMKAVLEGATIVPGDMDLFLSLNGDPRKFGQAALEMELEGKREGYIRALAEYWPKNDLLNAFAWGEENLTGQLREAYLQSVSIRLALLNPEVALDFSHLSENEPMNQMLRQFAPAGMFAIGQKEKAFAAIEEMQGEDRTGAVRYLAKQWVLQDEAAALDWINTLEHPPEFDMAIMGSYEHMSPDVQIATLQSVLQQQPDPGLERAVAHGIYRTASYVDPAKGSELIRTYMEGRDLPPVSQDLVHKQPNGEDVWEPETIMFRAVWNNVRHYNKTGRADEALQWLHSMPFKDEEAFLDIARSPAAAWARDDAESARAWVQSAPEISEAGRQDLIKTINQSAWKPQEPGTD